MRRDHMAGARVVCAPRMLCSPAAAGTPPPPNACTAAGHTHRVAHPPTPHQHHQHRIRGRHCNAPEDDAASSLATARRAPPVARGASPGQLSYAQDCSGLCAPKPTRLALALVSATRPLFGLTAHMALTRLDLPLLERPANASSGSPRSGTASCWLRNVAFHVAEHAVRRRWPDDLKLYVPFRRPCWRSSMNSIMSPS